MTMTGRYLRVEAGTLEALVADPSHIVDFLYPEEGREHPLDRQLNLDESWHGLHYLLNGDAWEGEEPLFNAVLGGTPIGEDDLGCGPVRFLDPDEVGEVADALEDLPVYVLLERFDPEAMNAAEVYPENWDAPPAADGLADAYESLRAFFRAAADSGDGLLMYLA